MKYKKDWGWRRSKTNLTKGAFGTPKHLRAFLKIKGGQIRIVDGAANV